jgi:hypothetical protein
VDIRIGVTDTARELEVELADDTDGDELRRQVESAIGDGTPVLWLTDRKGRHVGVVTARLGWIEIGTGADRGRIGFGG